MTDPLQRGISRLRDVDRYQRRETVGVNQGELIGLGFSEMPQVPTIPLKKATPAVHSGNSLTALQRKVFNALVLRAYDDLPRAEVKVHRIPMQDLMTIVGFNSKNTAALKGSMRELMTTTIEWSIIPERGAEVWEACTALAAVAFRDGICFYEFSQLLREKLHHPHRYAYLDLAEMRPLTSSPAVALYENAVRFKKLGFTPWYPIATWRTLLGATAETYDDWRRFREKVIVPAVEQVSEHTSISPSPEIMHDRRKVVAMRFALGGPDGSEAQMEDGEQGNEAAALPADAPVLLVRLVNDFMLTADQAAESVKRHGDEKVTIVADYVAQRFALGKVESSKLAPYFLTCLQGWKQDTRQESSLVVKRREHEEAKRKSAQEAHRLQELTDAFAPMYRGVSMQVFQQLPADERRQLESDFEMRLSADNSPMLAKWQQAPGDTVCQALFRNFLAERLLPPKKQLQELWISLNGDSAEFMAQVETLASERAEPVAALAV
ncbi:replication initiation protein [Pseudoxanthomonas kaohsiungensis]|uniref:Replication initiation protein n=1 Tax=Pseudoxanthomonas kaohsiungensis TaxID=283923 RepID=A0ABW3LZP1_9GAMM|nr:replication initiation protein [Pseudoxanthomonas kaohsiungensis]KAF1702961.1 hypothetical protein CSC66_09305 [Pseudoxanthomonas kaohsiungensis]